MRITNKIMQNNSLSNINKNKELEDKLNTQIATKKKITRPSDDPVVAIRALRLRTNLSEISQYYSKNVPDAKSWLGITEDAIDATSEIISDIYDNCTKGSQASQTATDRLKIIESLKGLRDGVYATGDADCAGRYLFTGYRTDTSLMFGKDTTVDYSITEKLSAKDVGNMTFVDVDNLDQFTESTAASMGTTEQDISSSQVHRMRLAYDDCSAGTAPSITYYDTSGTSHMITAAVASANDVPTPYLTSNWTPAQQTAGAVFIPETGELILNDTTFAALGAAVDNASTTGVDEGAINVTYHKSDWQKGDLRPEHYFTCSAGGVNYNPPTSDEDQVISYEVGFSQSLRVNTLAKDVFDVNIGRDVDEMMKATKEVVDMEDVVKKLEDMLEADPTNTALQERKAAADKAFDLTKTKMQALFEKQITRTQGYLDNSNLALTDVGNRTSKLALVENRLMSQKTSFDKLQSDNENIDITQAAVELSSVELAYEAALMATGKITQTTLLNYL